MEFRQSRVLAKETSKWGGPLWRTLTGGVPSKAIFIGKVFEDLERSEEFTLSTNEAGLMIMTSIDGQVSKMLDLHWAYVTLHFKLDGGFDDQEFTANHSGYKLAISDGECQATTIFFLEESEAIRFIEAIKGFVIFEKEYHPLYNFVGRLGSGASGEVFQVQQQLKLDSEIVNLAIKTITKEYLFNKKNRVEALKQEIEALRKIQSPFIVRLDRVLESSNNIYLVLELVEGVDLTRARLHALGTEERLKVLNQLTCAVQLIHREGIVHRDLKPQNIMIDKTGKIRVIDFGLSLDLNKLERSIDVRVGSPGFIAPELFYTGYCKTKINVSLDVFSLGATFYYLCTGENIFSGVSTRDLIEKNLNEITNLEQRPAFSLLSDTEKRVIKSMIAPKFLRSSLEEIITIMNESSNQERIKRLSTPETVACEEEYNYGRFENSMDFEINSDEDEDMPVLRMPKGYAGDLGKKNPFMRK